VDFEHKTPGDVGVNAVRMIKGNITLSSSGDFLWVFG
jgi:hypothetical protein